MVDKHDRRVRRQETAKSKKLPAPTPQSTDGETPVLRFSRVETKGRYALSAWQGRELAELVACFQKLEKMTWQEIRATSGDLGDRTGLAYQLLKKPKGFPADVKPFEVRVCEKKRLIGHREGRYFHVLRFDRDHATNKM